MKHLPQAARIVMLLVFVFVFTSVLNAQNTQRQLTPDIVFQFSSWSTVRIELCDASGQNELTCSYTEQGAQPKPILLNESEKKHLVPILHALKRESYSLSLPDRGIVVGFDIESVVVELNAISLSLQYRDFYERAKSHKPIKRLADWAKNKFPMISTPK